MDIYRFVPDDEERERISKAAGMGRDYDMDLVLATIKKVFEWGDEPCGNNNHLLPILRKRQCLECWQEVWKELEKGAISRKIGFGYLRQEIKESLDEGQ